MRDLLPDLERLAKGGDVGRAVVTSVWGSAPRPEGACLLARTDGALAGSVSGGCVEAATVEEIGRAITHQSSRLVRYGVSDETAWSVGLSCGGSIEVFVEPEVRAPVLEAARGPGGVVVASMITGPAPLGASLMFGDDGTSHGPFPPSGRHAPHADGAMELMTRLWSEIESAARTALDRNASSTIDLELADGEPVRIFLEVFPRQPRLVIFGAVQIAAALVTLARTLGYYTIVADGREHLLTRERFPDADELILAWPKAAFEQSGIDRATYVCVLSHDPKFDEPALVIALGSPACYVGAIGSKKTQAGRRERLREQGITPEQLARLHGPIGLELGGRAPAEIALAILAEMTMTRYKTAKTSEKTVDGEKR
jgi:xanthine dehydrogenase accessory factor